jgi:hypothetical protein
MMNERTYLKLWKQYLNEQVTSDDAILAKYPSYDENGNKIASGDIKQYITKPEVVVSRTKNGSSDAYFFRLKSRRGDSPGDVTEVAMYLPDTGEWIDVDTNTVIMRSKHGFSEKEAMRWLRHNGYLNRIHPRA